MDIPTIFHTIMTRGDIHQHDHGYQINCIINDEIILIEYKHYTKGLCDVILLTEKSEFRYSGLDIKYKQDNLLVE